MIICFQLVKDFPYLVLVLLLMNRVLQLLLDEIDHRDVPCLVAF